MGSVGLHQNLQLHRAGVQLHGSDPPLQVSSRCLFNGKSMESMDGFLHYPIPRTLGHPRVQILPQDHEDERGGNPGSECDGIIPNTQGSRSSTRARNKVGNAESVNWEFGNAKKWGGGSPSHHLVLPRAGIKLESHPSAGHCVRHCSVVILVGFSIWKVWDSRSGLDSRSGSGGILECI